MEKVSRGAHESVDVTSLRIFMRAGHFPRELRRVSKEWYGCAGDPADVKSTDTMTGRSMTINHRVKEDTTRTDEAGPSGRRRGQSSFERTSVLFRRHIRSVLHESRVLCSTRQMRCTENTARRKRRGRQQMRIGIFEDSFHRSKGEFRRGRK